MRFTFFNKVHFFLIWILLNIGAQIATDPSIIIALINSLSSPQAKHNRNAIPIIIRIIIEPPNVLAASSGATSGLLFELPVVPPLELYSNAE